jgi:hypothetical protein
VKLSVELFQKTLQHLKGETASGRVEKRSAPRVGLRARILLTAVRTTGLEDPIAVWTRDISRIGLGVISTSQFKIGDHYLLTICHEGKRAREKPLALYCTVRTCQAVTEQSYAVGLSFEDMRVKQFPKPHPHARSQPAPSSSTVSCVSPIGDEERIRRAILG